MKLKKPSLKGMKHTGYLGHFAQDKFIAQGHNDSGKADIYEKYDREDDRMRAEVIARLAAGQKPKWVHKRTKGQSDEEVFKEKAKAWRYNELVQEEEALAAEGASEEYKQTMRAQSRNRRRPF